VNTRIEGLNTKIFADGADLKTIAEMSKRNYVKGLTTNPTLMRKSGITDYEKFARSVLAEIGNLPISFEVFSDDMSEMARQALKISSWGENVYVKIPFANTKGEETTQIIKSLSGSGVKINVTAIMTTNQVSRVVESLAEITPSYISIFAGRIADTGRDPIPILKEALHLMSVKPNIELIWASPREALNILQANEIGCHVITVTSEILNKLVLFGKDLAEYSLETVQMFREDAVASGYSL